MNQPMQPLYQDPDNRWRFHGNQIVEHLLEHGGIDLNELAVCNFSQEDWEQFAQLIGYSLDGFSELSYVREATYQQASRQAGSEKTMDQGRIEYLEDTLDVVRQEVKTLATHLFRIHPDDLEP